MRISPKLEWMEAYVEVGISYISRQHKLARLGAWTIGKSKGSNEHGALYQDRKGAEFRIWLQTHYHTAANEVAPFSKIDMLCNLAHEIAHMEDWNHTPKHKKLESKILSAFMSLLKSKGYVSEEAELRK